MKKKIFVLFLMVALISVTLALGASAAKKLDYYEGDDDEISWIMYDDGELYIYGDCAIPNFTGAGDADWSFYTDKITSITIEEGITGIGRCAFSGLVKLKSVEIASSVKSIGMQAFYRCTKLEEVVLPKNVTVISSEAFSGCTKLRSVELGSEVTAIRSKAFEKCKALEAIELPDTLETIGVSAFEGCAALMKVYFYGDAPDLGDDAFEGVDEYEMTIYYTEEAKGFNKGNWNIYNSEIFDSTKKDNDDEDEEYDEDYLDPDTDFSEFELGDPNDDGKVNSTDRQILIKFLLGDPEYAHLEGAFCLDLDSDGELTIADDLILSRHIAGWSAYDDLYDLDI